MPMLITPIDKIARKKGRDVLYVLFDTQEGDWQNWTVRNQFMAWCDAHDIDYSPCGQMVDETYLTGHPYSRGALYIDVPFDENDAKFKVLSDKLEDKDGNFKIPGIEFWAFPLEEGMKNAHHDEAGFWERWAENQ